MYGASPRRALAAFVLVTVVVAGPRAAAAQGIDRVRPSLLREVMPEADRFDPAEGNPPVRRAYRGDELLGYVFLTSDLPPEERGYSGPIRAVVGMTPDGTLTGVRVAEYRESYMSTKGDFLRRPGFQEQYAGKHISESFRVYEDIDGIAKVSISVRALSRGVRDAARRVAAAYPPEKSSPTEPVRDVLSMSWFQMLRSGVAVRMDATAPGEDAVGISLVHLESETLARRLVGGLYPYIVNAVTSREAGDAALVLYAVDGPASRLPIQSGWSVEQGGVRTQIPLERVVMLGSPWEGLLAGETSAVGVLILDESVDIEGPLTFQFARGAEQVHTVAYTSQRALAVLAEASLRVPASPPPDSGSGSEARSAREDAASTATVGDGPGAGHDGVATPEPAAAGSPRVSASAASVGPEPASAAPLAAAATSPEQLVQLDFTVAEDESALQRLVSDTPWGRVGLMLVVLGFATLAFFGKRAALRWASLGITLAILGFVDGGFLSVSHLTGVIWVGPSAVATDLPLLLMVGFTLVTLLFWGRVFCGYLCPFGALQDLIDRVAPKRFKRELPERAHRAGLKAKYAILALILLPALVGVERSFYQYFEPFGTVFFLSTDVVLWTIAGAILAASVVVPRFYCRYACPLGASLALASLASLRRIPRVEQCDHCVVCERKCPTGAIAGPAIDFKECVRCNVCEAQLIERRGVCRHDMDAVRPRLVQLKTRIASGAARRA
jgi:polyferredoxin/Na+-translocating ferredoxin:NAD+ oxidoreductase RnfG subunit